MRHFDRLPPRIDGYDADTSFGPSMACILSILLILAVLVHGGVL